MAFLGVEPKHRGDLYKHVGRYCTPDEYAVTQVPKPGRYSKPCDMKLTYRGFMRAAQTYENDQGRKMQNFTLACTQAAVAWGVLAHIREREHKQTIALLESKNKDQHDVVVSLQCVRNKLADDRAKLRFENTTIARENRQIERENLLLANGVYNIIRTELKLNPEYKDNRPANADAQLVRVIMKSFWQRGLVAKANRRTLFKNLDCLRTGMALIMSHRARLQKE